MPGRQYAPSTFLQRPSASFRQLQELMEGSMMGGHANPGNGSRPGEPSRRLLAHREAGAEPPGGKMKLLTKVKKAC